MENRRTVYAMRIFNMNGYQPMAELAFGDGGKPTGETITIHYDDINERNKYYISAYTLVWDERVAISFNKYVFNNND